MYKISDYVNRGSIMVNNLLFPGNKKLASLMLYTTDLCNSRCRHCYIWEKKPKRNMSLSRIKELMQSKAICKNTSVGLEGGEFILHPEAESILKYFYSEHPNFDLLSNGVCPDRLISLVKKYPPKHLYLSLDGNEETHDNMRRVNGLYHKVLTIIKELKGILPVSVMFTLTPYNTLQDMTHVISVCKANNVDMRVGIYNNMDYFQTKESAYGKKTSLNYEINDLPSGIKDFNENYDFMVLYYYYRRNELKLTCNSINDSIVIYPNGDVPLCQNKQIILGNINNEPLEEILNKKNTLVYQKAHKECNDCWINFHRKYDIVLYRNMEKIFPRKIIRKVGGDYSWTKDPSKKYKDIFCI